MLVHPSGIALSSSTPRHLSRLPAARRRERGTRWRRLSAVRQALPALAHLRCGHTHAALAEADVHCWADKGYQDAGTGRVPCRARWENISAGQQAVNVSHARIRAVGEQAMATLKSWRLLRKVRCSTTRITDLVKAVLALHLATSN